MTKRCLKTISRTFDVFKMPFELVWAVAFVLVVGVVHYRHHHIIADDGKGALCFFRVDEHRDYVSGSHR